MGLRSGCTWPWAGSVSPACGAHRPWSGPPLTAHPSPLRWRPAHHALWGLSLHAVYLPTLLFPEAPAAHTIGISCKASVSQKAVSKGRNTEHCCKDCVRAVLGSQQNCQEGTEMSPTPSLHDQRPTTVVCFSRSTKLPDTPPAPDSMLTSRGFLVLGVVRVGIDMFPHASTAGLRQIVRGSLTGSALRSACVSRPSLAATDPLTVSWSCLFPSVPQLESHSMAPFVFPHRVIVLMKFVFIKK